MYYEEGRCPDTGAWVLSNFDNNKRDLVETALAKFPDESEGLFIHDRAFDSFGRLIPGDFALLTHGTRDLGEFWRKFESLKK